MELEYLSDSLQDNFEEKLRTLERGKKQKLNLLLTPFVKQDKKQVQLIKDSLRSAYKERKLLIVEYLKPLLPYRR